MTQRRSKKRTLISSIISLILCVSMLLGTTMAWFTDTVSNTGNRIEAGVMDLRLLKYDGTDYTDISDGTGDIFATEGTAGEIRWEPGRTEVVLLQVKNTGNLALNYRVVLEVTNEDAAKKNLKLEDAFSYALIPYVAHVDQEGKVASSTTDTLLNYDDLGITSWAQLSGLNGAEIGTMPAGITKSALSGNVPAEESDYFLLAVHMDEEADNNYQNLPIVIDLKVEAKQMTYEYDSFDNQYDVKAEYPADGIVYHVSTTGSDENPGTEEAPFATIAKANEVISASDDEEDVYVLIHGGTYYMSEGVTFSGASAGGSDSNQVVYKAAGDGEVVFSGYVQLKYSDFAKVDSSTWKDIFPEEAYSHILKIPLHSSTSYGLKYNDLKLVKTRESGKDTIEYVTLLLNGESQPLAGYPNYGQYETIKEVVNAGATSSDTTAAKATFKYSYPNIDNWSKTSITYAVVRGFLSVNYREEWNRIDSIDAENDTITLKYYTDFGVKGGRDWRIVNVPEELDVPGEFYFDSHRGSLALYWYPPYEITENDVIELSVAKDVYFVCEDTQNIVFDGIKFTGFRNTDLEKGVITLTNADNIEIRNCTFAYNEGGANVVITGNDNVVEACSFYNCGAAGVFLYGGGDYETLEQQNNTVKNNHFYNVGTDNKQGVGAALTNTATSSYTKPTVGNSFTNNLVHHIYGAVSVFWNGAEYDVSYNEISNGLRNLADYGMIYNYNRPTAQGNTINYNYVHDFGSLKDASMSTVGIYIDGWNSGQTIKNNIIVADTPGANTEGIISYGAYNTKQYNIVANTATGIKQFDFGKKISESSTLQGYVNKINSMSDALKTKYPFMVTLYNTIQQNNDDHFPLMGNVITDNVTYNAPVSVCEEAIEKGTVNNNVTVESSAFVDPDNHDWRITSAYASANNLSTNIVTDSNFSMDQIGIRKDVWDIQNPKESFRLIYPVNGSSDINPKNVTLNWEQALYADEYKYVVATDPELKDVVASGTSAYEYAVIGDLTTDVTYYWKVTAVNTTRQLGAEWASEGEVFSFTVGKAKANKEKLDETITEAETFFATVTDGTENKVGDYKVGTKAKLEALLQEASAMSSKEDATQEEVDAVVAKLRAAIDATDAYKYKGYVTVATDSVDKWVNTTTKTTTAVSDGVLTITGKKNVAYAETIPNYNLITFDVKPTLAAGYLGITFRTVQAEVDDCYDGISYLLWINADDGSGTKTIQLQKNPSESSSGEILAEVPNNGIVKNGVWQNMQIGAIDLEGGGVRLLFIVDGVTVFDFVDNSTTSQWAQIYKPGTLAFQSNQGTIEIKAAATIPTDIY